MMEKLAIPPFKAVRSETYQCICGYVLSSASERWEKVIKQGYFTATCGNLHCTQACKPVRVPVEIQTLLPVQIFDGPVR